MRTSVKTSKMNPPIKTLIHERVEQAQRGENPKVICRVPSGWVVLGDAQLLRGYSLLLPDPVVPNLNALNHGDRIRFLLDMTIIGDALEKITGALRMNYEILGNTDPALHAHVFPRFADEPQERRTSPVWFYDWKAAPQFDFAIYRSLMTEIAQKLKKLHAVLGTKCEIAPSLNS